MEGLDSSSWYQASTRGSKVALVDSTPFVPGCSTLDSDSSSMAGHIHSPHSGIPICMEFFRMANWGSIGLEPLAPVVVEAEAVVERQGLVVDSKFLEGSVELGHLQDYPPRLRTPRILGDVHGSKVWGSNLGWLGSKVRRRVGSKVLVEVVGDSKREGWVFGRSNRSSSNMSGSGTSRIRSIHMSIASFWNPPSEGSTG